MNACLTQREIAKEMGISRQAVSALEKRALAKCARKIGVPQGVTLRAFKAALLRALQS